MYLRPFGLIFICFFLSASVFGRTIDGASNIPRAMTFYCGDYWFYTEGTIDFQNKTIDASFDGEGISAAFNRSGDVISNTEGFITADWNDAEGGIRFEADDEDNTNWYAVLTSSTHRSSIGYCHTNKIFRIPE